MGTKTIDEEVSQSALVHERLRESPFKRWVLLDGNRYVLATILSAIVGGTLPFITIVLAINQLVLSQELGWTGDLQQRFDAMRAFRREVEETTATPVSPAAPAPTSSSSSSTSPSSEPRHSRTPNSAPLTRFRRCSGTSTAHTSMPPARSGPTTPRASRRRR
ncbi:hypothetical protein ACYJ1Y_16385 [Natrialbaceae archaeon A-gly3]